VQQNLGFPRSGIGNLYFVGGLISFVTMRIGGSVVDRRGSVLVTALGSGVLILVVAASFLPARPWLPVMGIFIGFMMCNSFRGVALNTLSTRVPLPTERARFMSAQSAAQHLAAAAGGGISALVLSNAPGGELVGMNRLGVLTMFLTALVPIFVALVTARVRRREEPKLQVASV
jgi:predicted MFS family arabinose efflux permease